MMIPYLPYFFDELRKTAGIGSDIRRGVGVLTGSRATRLEGRAARLAESATKSPNAQEVMDLSRRLGDKAKSERRRSTVVQGALLAGAAGGIGASAQTPEKTAGPLWEKTKIVGKGALAGAVGVGAGLGALEGAKHMGLKIPPKYVPYALGAIGAASAATYGVYKSMEAKELADVDQAEANRRSGAAIR